jgi:hypothetical protein
MICSPRELLVDLSHNEPFWADPLPHQRFTFELEIVHFSTLVNKAFVKT